MRQWLTREEEALLCARARSGDDDARNRLAVEHLGLAAKLARRAARGGRVDFEDLLQEAVLGIFHAIRKFDPRKTTGRFGSYAGIWIRQRLAVAIGDAGPIRVPRHARALARSGRAAPTAAKREQVEAARRAMAATVAPVREWDRVERPLDDDDGDEALAAAFAALPMIQRHVLRRLRGLDGGEPEAREAVAADIGCVPATVAAIERSALARLRAALAGRRDREPPQAQRA